LIEVGNDLDSGDDLVIQIEKKIREIIDLVDSDRLQNLNFEKEEETLLQKIMDDLRNKDWRLVKKDLTEEENEEAEVLRLELNEIKLIHTKFRELVEMMGRSNLLIPDTEKEFSMYFKEMYKFAIAYEAIMFDLYKKEKMLLEQMEKDLE
jgi:hypothetical protein